MYHSGAKVRTGFEKEEVARFRFEPPDLADLGIKALVPDLGITILIPRSWYQDLGTRILVPRSWYQDPGTKILVPKKNGEPERRSLSVCRGVQGAAGPPPGSLGGWKPPRKSRGSEGRQPPVKTISWTQNHLPTTFNHLQPTTFPLPFLRKR